MNEKHQRITEIITIFAELVDRKVSDLLMKMYIKLLDPYPLDKIQAAAEHLFQTKTFNKLPLPAEFIQYIDPPEDRDAQALKALETALDKIDHRGGNYSVCFDDPVIHRVIHFLGGWVAFCDSTRELRNDTDWRFWRREFVQAYKSFSTMTEIDIPRLPGRFEIDNRLRGTLDDEDMLLLPDGTKQPAAFIEDPKDDKKQLPYVPHPLVRGADDPVLRVSSDTPLRDVSDDGE